MDCVIRSNANYETVESGMVELTQSNAVRNVWFTFRTAIGNDMGCVKEFVVPQSAKRTLGTVGGDNPLSE
jgi:hypothetical protein